MADAECQVYEWIGQDFHYCDDCSRPFWEHAYSQGVSKAASPFGPPEYELDPITDKRRQHIRSQWCVGAGCRKCPPESGT